jgi:hypothetical protein|tara:strand:- start:1342 stop:1524 length:183 start_codon:yes stop_codon:yes gene_type:complete
MIKDGSMKPTELQILICEKMEINAKIDHWKYQKRKADKYIKKYEAETKKLEKKIAKEKLA